MMEKTFQQLTGTRGFLRRACQHRPAKEWQEQLEISFDLQISLILAHATSVVLSMN
jgi:hypothetical protein